MGDLDRVRWHCRRGLLELDIVLSRFLESGYGRLSPRQKESFSELLQLADNDLWDMVTGRMSPSDPDQTEVVRQLRDA